MRLHAISAATAGGLTPSRRKVKSRDAPPGGGRPVGTSLHNPDWAAYAELCGATGIKADRRDQLDQAMARLFATDGPAMLHVTQDPELL